MDLDMNTYDDLPPPRRGQRRRAQRPPAASRGPPKRARMSSATAPHDGGQPIRVGTDCSGWESIIMALNSLGVSFSHSFSSDINPAAQETLKHNYSSPHHVLYRDLTERCLADVPAVDLYHAGFPCQPFSVAGKGRGTNDVRGTVIFSIMEYIKLRSPRLVVLENVKGLASRHKDVLEWIRGALRGLNYWVSCRVLNAKDHGVPQNRERLFIVGIHQLGAPDAANLFKWPTKMPAVCLGDFLDPKDESDNPRRLPPKSQTIARKHVQRLLAALRKEGLDPTTARLIVDCDGTKCHSMCGVSPCLTRTRCCNGGHWVLSRGRRLTTQEQERLFGLHVQPPSGGHSVAVQRPPAVGVRAWGAIIGNSIPVPMLARILCKALPAAGLLPGAVQDAWDPRDK